MDYLKVNKDAWNLRVDGHVEGDFYDMENFLNGASSLKEIELAYLEGIKGKTVLHLQCHFGQDTFCLERLGAIVTGVDLSDKAIEKANSLKNELNSDANFICSDVFDLPERLDEKFDYVFATYGTIGWLPDIQKWAKIISKFLKPSGKLVFAEFHPVVWMYNDDFSKVIYKYSRSEPILETEDGSYGNRDTDQKIDSITWNHSVSDVISALQNHGLAIQDFQEYHFSPWNCLAGMKEIAKDRFIIESIGEKLPMSYSILAKKSVSPAERILGDATAFLDEIFSRLTKKGIETQSFELDHICYRVSTIEEYQTIKTQLLNFGELLIESEIGGRNIATFKLYDPIYYLGRKIYVLELPAPKTGSNYQSGFEHVEFVIDQSLESFEKQYVSVGFDRKGMNKPLNADLRVFLDGLSVKFHLQRLEKVIEIEKAM